MIDNYCDIVTEEDMPPQQYIIKRRQLLLKPQLQRSKGFWCTVQLKGYI